MAAPRPLQSDSKPVAFSSNWCVMHVVPYACRFISFTSISYMNFVSFAAEWRKYDCKEDNVVGETSNKLGLDFVNVQSCIDAVPSSSNVGYHYECYRIFCDVSKVNS